MTSKPMHASTRALSWKAAGDPDPLPEFAAIRASFDLDRRSIGTKAPAKKSTGRVRVATFDC